MASIQSHHLHLQWKFKLLSGNFAWGLKAKYFWVLSTNFWKQKVCCINQQCFALLPPGYLLLNLFYFSWFLDKFCYFQPLWFFLWTVSSFVTLKKYLKFIWHFNHRFSLSDHGPSESCTGHKGCVRLEWVSWKFFCFGLIETYSTYPTRAIKTHSWFEIALVYKPRILSFKKFLVNFI